MRYDTGRPRAVSRLRISQLRTTSLPCPVGLRAPRPSPMMDLAHATLPQSWIQREHWEFETHRTAGGLHAARLTRREVKDGTPVVETPALWLVGKPSHRGTPHHINPLLCPSGSDTYFEAVATAKRSAVHFRLDGPFGCGSLVHQSPVDNADKRFRLLRDVL